MGVKGDWANAYGLEPREIAEAQLPTAPPTLLALWNALAACHGELKQERARVKHLRRKIKRARRTLDM